MIGVLAAHFPRPWRARHRGAVLLVGELSTKNLGGSHTLFSEAHWPDKRRPDLLARSPPVCWDHATSSQIAAFTEYFWRRSGWREVLTSTCLSVWRLAVDAPVRSGVALLLDFLPKNQAMMFSVRPSFENRGCKWVKGTVLLAPFLGFGKGTLLEP